MESDYDISAILEEFRSIGRDSEYCPEPEERSEYDVALENSTVLAYQRYTMECPPRRYRYISRMFLPKCCQENQRLCTFCRSNGEIISFYLSHSLKDQLGRICCPILSRYVCETCGATGAYAHTIKYCPFNPFRHRPALITTLKSLRNSIGVKRS